MNGPFTHWQRRYVLPAYLTTGVLLMPAFGLSASALLFASNHVGQNATVSTVMPSQQTVALKSLLKQWESDYQVTIFYESELVRDKQVLPELGAGTLETKLEAVLPQADLQFKKLRRDYFVVTSKPAKAANVQDITVSGRVMQANGDGLPGVTVIVKGTTTGTSTGADGSFTLSVPEGSTLVFSSVGYVRQEAAVTGQNQVFTIRLAEDQQALNEVVVVGYGTQTRQELTTSVTSVSGRDIARQPVAGFDQALQGQAPGVQVTSPTGAPGAGINIRIRGNNSVTLTNSPLYVIDGVPVLPTYDRELSVGNQKPNPLNAINPNDIESIDVLKDGAAAAIYGLRSSNGVVVITTKRGKVGKAQVGFNMYYGRQSLRKKIDMLNSRQFASYYNEARLNAGQAPAYGNPDTIRNNTNWQDETYRSAAIQNYQLSIGGGTDKTRYYVSGGYFKQDGIILNSGFDRFNFKLNLDQQGSDKFRFGTNLNLSRTNNNGSVRSELPLGSSGTVLGALAQIPTIPVRSASGRYALNPFSLSDNPVGNLLETSNKAITYQVIGNVYGEYDLLKNLKFRTSLGIDFRTQLENEFLTREYPGTSNAASATRGSGRTGTTQQTIWLWENTLTYNPNLGEKNHLTLLAGQSVQESDRFTSNASVQGYPSNAVPYLLAGTTRTGTSSYEEQWGLMSYFGRALYDYDGRYLASVSLRADGSSRFEKKFGYFPAVGLGWRISKEAFFPQAGFISDLKLRGSLGANGNQEIGVYDRFTTYGTGNNYQGSGNSVNIVGGISPQRIGNLDVKWETTYQYNAGIDFGFKANRIVLTLDAYSKQTMDLLTNVPLAPSTGAQALDIIQNVGKTENKGIEVGLNTTNFQGENNGFSWTTNFNFTINRNKVVSLGTLRNDQNQSVDRDIPNSNGYSITRNGASLGSFYGYRALGIFQSQDEINAANATARQLTGNANALYQPNASPGDIRFADVNGDGVVDGKDLTIIGNPNPKSIAGVTNNFGYKGLELSVFFQASFGNDIYNANLVTIEGQNGAVNQTTRTPDHWSPTNTTASMPRPIVGDPNQNNRVSSRFIEDGSYVRLKNLTLAYTIPTGITQKAHIGSLRLYATTQNLITWTHYSGYDPEVSADPFSSTGFGRDLGVYPQARTYTFGLNASF